MKSLKKMALIYDFDGTLSAGNMQEYDFIPQLGYTPAQFWERASKLSESTDSDQILSYLSLMITESNKAGLSIRRETFVNYGKKVKFFEGVQEWFNRINAYAKERGLEVEHYINSSGLKEMIEGTSIARYFKHIYACTFFYNVDGVAYWPAVAVNYTNKTQFIFKINKGIDEVADSKKINEFFPEEQRPIPFERMIYIGDGTTDIPCMRLVKEKRGYAIAVYNPESQKNTESMQRLIKDHRVNFVCPTDYREGSKIDSTVKAIIDKIAAEITLDGLQQTI